MNRYLFKCLINMLRLKQYENLNTKEKMNKIFVYHFWKRQITTKTPFGKFPSNRYRKSFRIIFHFHSNFSRIYKLFLSRKMHWLLSSSVKNSFFTLEKRLKNFPYIHIYTRSSRIIFTYQIVHKFSFTKRSDSYESAKSNIWNYDYSFALVLK